MFPYAVETFTAAEEDILRRYVTNLDLPVFALVNLPEVVKGALFARYSRSPKSLRRLFLDEFVGDLDISGDATVDATVGPEAGRGALREGVPRVRRRLGGPARRRAPGLRAGLQRPDQGARAGPAHGLPRAVDPLHRLRQPADHRPLPLLPGPGLLESPLGARYVGEMDRMFDTYGELLPRSRPGWPRVIPARPATPTSSTARRCGPRRSTPSAACCRPASLSNVGIYGTGQSYEHAAAADARAPAPRGARSYADHDARRAAQGHPVVSPAGRPARTGGRVVDVPRRGPGPRRPEWSSASSPTWSEPATARRRPVRRALGRPWSTSIPTARTR